MSSQEVPTFYLYSSSQNDQLKEQEPDFIMGDSSLQPFFFFSFFLGHKVPTWLQKSVTAEPKWRFFFQYLLKELAVFSLAR
jgi:hypothetical protein